LCGILLCLAAASGCRSSRILLSPPPLPADVESVEGYASIKISGEKETARSRFSFLFQVPDRGWIEVRNFLGSTLYQIVIDREEAYFILPSKKVFWQGPEEEILDVFLGFRLGLDDMISLLFGLWSRTASPNKTGSENAGWQIEKDREGRIIAGTKEDLSFRVEEFIEKTSFSRILNFEHPYSRGQIKILRVKVNSPIREELFEKLFLKRFQRKTWAEIREILNGDH